MSRSTRALTTGLGAVVVAAQCLLGVGTAEAAGGGMAYVDGVAIRYTAAAGDVNLIKISLANGAYLIEDSVPITAGPGCSALPPDPTKVQCLAMGVLGMDINAGDLDDTINNTTATSSFLRGEGGDDLLHGGGGDDTLRGGPGADTMYGHGGTDGATYFGTAAGVTANLDGLANDGAAGENDRIGSDVEDLYGGNGIDTLTGNGSGNVLVGNGAHDVLTGNGGADYFSGGEGDDTLIGGAGNDSIHGGPGNDDLSGGEGDDALAGEAGDDWMHGGSDTLPNYGGADTFAGGADVDTVSYAGYYRPVYADLDGQVGDDGVNQNSDVEPPEHDTIGADVENLVGGQSNDQLVGNAGDNVLDGAMGDDYLYGLGGTDTVTYANRSNPVTAKLDGVKNDGEFNEFDSIASTVENLVGGANNDVLWGDGQDNRLDGGPGVNSLDGKGGVDVCVNGAFLTDCNP
ncbi:MAG: hypothetical protein HOV94_10710 [Saccharothrix sp.]|nr:hypothetical protein [Saccharothrix sp.]